MKASLLLPCILLLLIPRAVCGTDGVIYINVSFKLILHPADGQRPRLDPNDLNTRVTDASIDRALQDANSFLASYGRGYRIRVVETLTIGGINQSHSNRTRTEPGYYSIQDAKEAPLTFQYPAGYVDPNGMAPVTGPLIDVLDQNARSSAATKMAFAWNDNAVNIFVPSGWSGGGGISPQWGDAAGFGYFEGWLLLHELGHYFNLRHTFDGDEFVADTLIDPNSVTLDTVAQDLYAIDYDKLNATQRNIVDIEYARRARNSIAAANPLSSPTYTMLSAAERNLVDDVFFNIMSYYDPPHRNALVTRMTEGQADRFADTCNGVRHPALSGYTRNVSISGSNLFFGIANSALLSAFPARTVAHAAAQAAAGPGDDEFLLLQPGNYNEQIRISTPCTIRATRKGAAVIGRP